MPTSRGLSPSAERSRPSRPRARSASPGQKYRGRSTAGPKLAEDLVRGQRSVEVERAGGLRLGTRSWRQYRARGDQLLQRRLAGPFGQWPDLGGWDPVDRDEQALAGAGSTDDPAHVVA